jgi:hypothetical protein
MSKGNLDKLILSKSQADRSGLTAVGTALIAVSLVLTAVTALAVESASITAVQVKRGSRITRNPLTAVIATDRI